MPDKTYEFDITFKAELKNPDAPVTAKTGKPLPAGGGEAGKAYLDRQSALNNTRSFEEYYQVVSKTTAAGSDDAEFLERLRDVEERDPKNDTPEKKKKAVEDLLKMFRQVSSTAKDKITGGFLSNEKATLHIKDNETEMHINMHLENGQWKVGKRQLELIAGANKPTEKPVKKAPAKARRRPSR